MTGFLTVFITVFLAELGDKTQLASLFFAADGDRNPWVVFIAAASALVVSTGVAVLLGAAAERYLTAVPLKLVAGLGFLAVGALMIAGHFNSTSA